MLKALKSLLKDDRMRKKMKEGKQKMYKVGIVLCYMGGQLHEYFDKFLISCKYNPTIDWLLFTDDRSDLQYPGNVKVHYMIFEELREKIHTALEREICLESPRGLCNYKVMYGQIFKEELTEYDYWGYCDCDLIWGNLRKFLTDELFEAYGKIGIYGHLTLMKNDEFHRTVWRDAAVKFREWMGVDIFAEGSRAWSFDETPGIDRYFREMGLPQYSKRLFESYQPDKEGFIPDDRKNYEKGIARIKNRKYCRQWRIRRHVMFEYDRGSLYRVCLIHGKVCREEILYAHFPGGKKFGNHAAGEHFYVIPYEFLEKAELTPKWIRAHSKEDYPAQKIRLAFLWYRGVAAKKFPACAKAVKKIMRRA